MTPAQILAIALLVVLNALVLCGGASFLVLNVRGTALFAPPPATQVSANLPPATATATPTLGAPPTPTATATWVIPLAPLAPPTSGATGVILAAANKSKLATSYRMEMSMSIKGELSQLTGVTGKDQELPMLTMSGEMSGSSSHVTMKGFLGLLFTGDVNKGMEMITVGGKNYVHGPMPLLGAKDNRWYILPAQQSSPVQSALEPGDLLSSFGGRDMDLSKFSQVATETFDNRRCDVYAADPATARAMFGSLSAKTQLNQGELALLDKSLADSEFKLWICDDGYFHQMRMGFTAQDPSKPSQSFGVKLLLHIYDLNSTIKIAAPTGAIPATSPFLATPTATPKKK